MHLSCRAIGVALLIIGSASASLAQSAGPASQRVTRIQRARPGAPLTEASNASPAMIVATYLRTRGHGDATIQSLTLLSTQRAPASGVTHLRFEQRVGELAVYGVYVRASLNARGELISVIENLVTVPAASAVDSRVGHGQALGAAMRHLFGADAAPPGLLRREGNTAVFERTPFFHRGPRVTAVAVPRGDGLLGMAFLVETWTQERNLLHHTLVGGGGELLNVELRTNNDSYKVFSIDPEKTAQTTVGPVGVTAESPEGWLIGSAHTSINISGNNAHAYLDDDADNTADPGGVAVGDNFVADADTTAPADTEANRAVAVQNLFYLTNVIHDALFQYGFTEAAGNFQESNFSGQGEESDSVNAEAQDGSGTDNANFATPTDGSNPRMQMFLWNPLGTHEVVVGSSAETTYLAQGASFGPTLDVSGINGPIALADDGSGNHLACSRLPRRSLSGAVALVDRGTCDFTVKVKNAQAAGAIAVIIANNIDGAIVSPGGSGGGLRTPAAMVSKADGEALKMAVGEEATLRLKSNPPPMRDSALDSDIVWHEYGHGLTWRMIGGMSGPLAGAIGEGMGDALAIIVNDNDRIGEYSASDPAGIRSEPYANYSRTYGDFSSTGEHFDGEIYAAIVWRLWQNFQAATITQDQLLTYLVQGMNATPATPSFEDMRDGILVATGGDAEHSCLVWEAFAHYGVGVGASATVSRRGIVSVVESTTVPPECVAPAPLSTNAND